MAKRLSTLTKFRLEKVAIELKEIRSANSFNKIDCWNLDQVIEMLLFVLTRSQHSTTVGANPDAK